MDYVVIARKYRPQTFLDVVGQTAIARTLTNAIRRERVAHGFLFTGPSGVGKTTMARILAKALACVEGPTATPCGVCDHCRGIADSRHPDVYEIDAATHNGVDAIRELSENATFSPSMARYRIYILDEVHMLSTSAWNALLKLIEEPPEHVYFIFATTEVDKVPATVVNRCQRFDFRAIDLADIVSRLQAICEQESVSVDAGLLTRIARAASGGMREAQTVLDQLIAIADGTPSEDDLNLLLGAARLQDIHALVDAILGGSHAEALATCDRLCGDGVAPITLLEQLIDHLRQLMLLGICGPEHPAVLRLGPVPEAMLQQQGKSNPEQVVKMCQLALTARQAVKHGVEARLQLDMAMVRLAGLARMVDYETLMRRIQRLEKDAPASPS